MPIPLGNRFKVRTFLLAIAVAGLLVAWLRYPAENHFSVLSCTISFLGSPDANRNPEGWRFYQVGMTALLLLLCSFAAERHVKLRPRIGSTAMWSSAAITVSFALLMAATWIPDSRQGEWFGMRTGEFHTRIAIIAIPFMAGGILLDGVALRRSGVRFRVLWPFVVFGLLMVTGTSMLMAWKRMCRVDSTLSHWPGDGLYSTPLWEWIAFTYLVGLMVWLGRTRAWQPTHNAGGQPRSKTAD